MERILDVSGLRKEYGKFALQSLTFHIPRGYIMGLIGPNGSGKTTTIRILMNMINADAGNVSIFGVDPGKEEKMVKNRIGFVGEEQFFYENKSPEWTGKFVSNFFEKWDTARFRSLLDRFGIDRKKKIKNLSRGMKVKLSIAIALSHDPELLILDEPTAGLDPVIRREVLDLLSEFRGDEERSILISSHITDDIMRIADQVAFIVDGSIVIDREKDDILSNWKRIHFRQGSLPESLERRLKCVSAHAFGSSGITGEFLEIKDRLDAGVEAGDIKVENVSLDDVLIAFVKGEN